MNIVFVIKALSNQGGGAERVFVDVVSGLVRRGHVVTVISNDPEGQDSYYALEGSVRRINLGIGNVAGKSSVSLETCRLLRLRREIIAIKPDVVVAFMHSSYITVGLALVGTGLPMVASEHTAPAHYKTRPMQRILLMLAPLLSKKITVVSKQVKHSFIWWLRRNMVVVANPVFVPTEKPTKRCDGLPLQRTLLTVGGLAPQKNQQCLISAFASIEGTFPDWKLRIVGEGELRAALEQHIGELGLTDRVELPGSVADISKEYFGADLFVLPSKYESFGLATAEALLHGLPAIGFADCPGTNELIRHHENGLLVSGSNPDQALADAMASLMGDSDERLRLSNATNENLVQNYGLDGVIDRWEAVLHEAIA